MKIRAMVLVSLFSVVTYPAMAQTCSNTATTGTLICVVPQLFGAGGLTLNNPNHRAHFQSASLDTFQPVNTAIGEALSTLPLGSAGSGVSFTFDKQHVPIPNEDSLGPILTERAGVIGRGKINVGVAYQYFSFSKIDGLNLNSFPAVLGHAQFLINGQKPSFENDYITTGNTVKVALNQAVLYGVVGLTNRLDVSAEIPIESVHLRVVSNAHIVRTVPCEATATCNDRSSILGEYHFFGSPTTNAEALAATDATFNNGGDSTGIGDVMLRAKYQVVKAEKVGASVGIGFRLPSGDANNFLGSGTVGVAPFGAFTYRARLSPHVRFGYQWNGDSVLVGNPTTSTGSKASLPPEWLYSAGADYRVTNRITAAVDLIGERVLGASRLSLGTFNDVLGNTISDIQSNVGDYSSTSIGVGGKVRLKRELVLVGNVTMRVDNGGLRASAVPLIGLSYAF